MLLLSKHLLTYLHKMKHVWFFFRVSSMSSKYLVVPTCYFLPQSERKEILLFRYFLLFIYLDCRSEKTLIEKSLRSQVFLCIIRWINIKLCRSFMVAPKLPFGLKKKRSETCLLYHTSCDVNQVWCFRFSWFILLGFRHETVFCQMG